MLSTTHAHKSHAKNRIDSMDKNDLKCVLCEDIVKKLDDIIGKNSSASKINSTVYDLCEKFEETVRLVCLQFAPKLVTAIEGGADPKKACTDLKLCTSHILDHVKVKPDNVKRRKVDSGTITGTPNDLKCVLCEDIVKKLDDIVGKNSSASKINSTVYDVCEKFPDTIQPLCLQFAPKLVTAIEGGADPKKACTDLKLCTSHILDHVKVKPDNVKRRKVDSGTITGTPNDLKCVLCEDIVKKLDDIVGKNSSASKINSTVYDVCEKFPDTIQPLCLQYAPMLVKAIEGGADPKKACTVIKLCPEYEDIVMLPPASENDALYMRLPEDDGARPYVSEMDQYVPPPLHCDMCMNVMEGLTNHVAGDYPKVQRVVQRICDEMPRDSFSLACKNLMSSNLSLYWKKLIEVYSPSMLCEMADCVENIGLPKLDNRS